MSDPGVGRSLVGDGGGLRGIQYERKDSEPRCDGKLDEDCRRRKTTDDGGPIIETGRQLEWIQHSEVIGYSF